MCGTRSVSLGLARVDERLLPESLISEQDLEAVFPRLLGVERVVVVLFLGDDVRLGLNPANALDVGFARLTVGCINLHPALMAVLSHVVLDQGHVLLHGGG